MRKVMSFLRDVLFGSRGPLLMPENVEKIREASRQAYLRSNDRLTNTIDDVLNEHRKLKSKGEEDNGPDH